MRAFVEELGGGYEKLMDGARATLLGAGRSTTLIDTAVARIAEGCGTDNEDEDGNSDDNESESHSIDNDSDMEEYQY